MVEEDPLGLLGQRGQPGDERCVVRQLDSESERKVRMDGT